MEEREHCGHMVRMFSLRERRVHFMLCSGILSPSLSFKCGVVEKAEMPGHRDMPGNPVYSISK